MHMGILTGWPQCEETAFGQPRAGCRDAAQFDGGRDIGVKHLQYQCTQQDK
jgi:hypothetical protein